MLRHSQMAGCGRYDMSLIAHYIAHGPDDAEEALEEMKAFARNLGLTPDLARMYKKAGVIVLEVKK